MLVYTNASQNKRQTAQMPVKTKHSYKQSQPKTMPDQINVSLNRLPDQLHARLHNAKTRFDII